MHIGSMLSVAAAAALTTGAVHAAPAASAAGMSPQQQAHMAKVVAAQRARLAPEYNYDIRPAVLKGISVKGPVKANLKNAQAVVVMKVADNLTGVSRIEVTLDSPSGQRHAWGTWRADFPKTRDQVELAIDMDEVSENGLWRVSFVNVIDANEYGTAYDEAALAAMGSTTFTVSGALGDEEYPNAQPGGTNLTPTVSLSTPPRGMLPGRSPRVGVELNVSDAGASGVRSARLEFCHEMSEWDCFSMGGDLSRRGQASARLILGGELYGYMQTGRYRPSSLSVTDFAGNMHYLWVYQGDDLDGLLDNPVIVITE
ncbi:MAG: hypothetical protein HY856_09985 [Burkholderiales bacterium]|nr:hypothetical protein [Burkholderiales bacterium]